MGIVAVLVATPLLLLIAVVLGPVALAAAGILAVAVLVLAGLALLEVWLARVVGDPRWRFVGADPCPEVLTEAEMDALLDLLAARS